MPAYNVSDNIFQRYDFTQQTQSQSTMWVLENTLAYSYLISRHKFDLLAGMSAENSSGGLFLQASNHGARFDDFEHAYISNTLMDDKINMSMSGHPGEREALASFFGRVNYNYAEKYRNKYRFR